MGGGGTAGRRSPRGVLGMHGDRGLTCSATNCPERLRGVAHPPPLLFARGELADDAHAVTVVSTRRPSLPGLRLASEVASGLAAAARPC